MALIESECNSIENNNMHVNQREKYFFFDQECLNTSEKRGTFLNSEFDL